LLFFRVISYLYAKFQLSNFITEGGVWGGGLKTFFPLKLQNFFSLIKTFISFVKHRDIKDKVIKEVRYFYYQNIGVISSQTCSHKCYISHNLWTIGGILRDKKIFRLKVIFAHIQITCVVVIWVIVSLLVNRLYCKLLFDKNLTIIDRHAGSDVLIAPSSPFEKPWCVI